MVLPYSAYRRTAHDLDVIAFEGRGLVSRAIRAVTGGTVTHVGLALWWGETLMLVESRELRGGRAVRLSEEIPAGGVLVYRSPALIERLGDLGNAPEFARAACGAAYSYVGVLRFLRRLGLPTREPVEDRRTRGARFCSELVSAAYRLGGIDLCPGLRDSETSPADLVASERLELVGRVVPSESITAPMKTAATCGTIALP